MSDPATIDEDAIFPFPTFATSRPDSRKKRFPQCIAHRGYKAHHAENTLGAFRAAIAIGAHALETDLQITKDDVVVLSHDATLKRCFNLPDKIADLTWRELQHLTTRQHPHDPLPRLSDLLTLLAEPANAHIWLLLDIKISNEPERIMRLLAATFAFVPNTITPIAQPDWSTRTLLGIWAAKYLPPALSHLPTYPVTHIGFALSYARHFFNLPHVSFNLFLPMLIAPGGRNFIHEAREVHSRPVMAWTVNEADAMAWSVRRGLDGVVTDEPGRFLRTCADWGQGRRVGVEGDGEGEDGGWGFLPVSAGRYWRCLRVWLWFSVLRFWSLKGLGVVASRELVGRSRGGKEGSKDEVSGEQGGVGGRLDGERKL